MKRFNKDIKIGLTKNEIKYQIDNGNVNKDTTIPTKSISTIILSNIFTLFNMLNLSLGFMAITSSEQAYSDFKNAGASDAAAGIGMLASIAALYGLMTSDYFRDQLFKGTVLDESEAVDVIKNYTEVEGKPIIEAISGGNALSKKQAVNLFNQLYDGIKNR